ncbi:MAG TPA: dihydrofolate reductase family protein [Devosiaceae bacterium]|jgi:dihydrofolate reductase|nr:dihydrofolate reductase family protein [Devosiaceae bacterium]
MKLVTMQFISLDGVYQGPGSPEEDRSDGFDRGGWLVPFIDQVFQARIDDWTEQADAFLFGRRTYDAFAAFWPTIVNPTDKNAGQLNSRPKYVATSRPFNAGWAPVTLLTGNLVEQVSELKAQPGRELQVHGSGRLTGALMKAGLIDEVRLVMAPVVVGDGRKLFTGTPVARPFSLREQVRTPGGLTLSSFTPTSGDAAGTYVRRERV